MKKKTSIIKGVGIQIEVTEQEAIVRVGDDYGTYEAATEQGELACGKNFRTLSQRHLKWLDEVAVMVDDVRYANNADKRAKNEMAAVG
jgi:hypothetical protein